MFRFGKTPIDVAAHFHIQENIMWGGSSRAARFARGAAASRQRGQRARQRLATHCPGGALPAKHEVSNVWQAQAAKLKAAGCLILFGNGITAPNVMVN